MPEPVIELEGVTRRYQGVTAVDGVSASLRAGESVGLIGPNGAGKTTLFNLVSGFVRPDSGHVRWRGNDITASSVAERARRGLIRTFQHVQVFGGLSVDDNLLLAQSAAQRGGRTARSKVEILDLLGLGGVRQRQASQLSYGLARKLSLGMALMLQPALLLLDEPAAGLTSEDLDDVARILNQLRELTTLWVVEHDIAFITECCERVLVLDAGRCIADTSPDKLADDPRVVEAYLGGAVQ